VEGAIQSFVPLPVFDRSRRSVLAQVRVWTDLGESAWSQPVRLESGLLGEQDWQARWMAVLADHGYLDTAYELLFQDTPPSWLTMMDRGATPGRHRWTGPARVVP
jgi:Bacterial alpha-L-rhamnosidase 6 hairpin glycosidase domain